MDEGLREYKAIYHCVNCGDEIGMVKRIHCTTCMSKAGREQKAKLQKEIDARLEQLKAEKKWIYANEEVRATA